jgi:3-phenylpropionate/trans-cinnamate dioxygenase ferredoxin subunit
MARERVLAAADLPPGGVTCVKVNGRPICLVHGDDGAFYALDDMCSHEEASLSDGWTSGTEIECPLHNSMFDLQTGEPTSLPATEPVQTYPVTVDDGSVFIEFAGEVASPGV